MSRVKPSLDFIPPQLASSSHQPPAGKDWIHEVKHDGYRTMLVVDRGKVRAFTRNGFDWSDKCQRIVAVAAKLPCREAILDGEVVVQDRRGASDFEALQKALKARGGPMLFYGFDLFASRWC